MKYTIESERLILRPFSIEDAYDMYNGWTSDPEVTKYVKWSVHKNVEETAGLLSYWELQYDIPERINFAITLKEDGKLIGGIDVVGYEDGLPIIGYNISRSYWNNGYMTEACNRVLEFLFELGHSVVRIDAMVENVASNKVITKCGGKFIETYNDSMKDKEVVINKYYVYKE